MVGVVDIAFDDVEDDDDVDDDGNRAKCGEETVVGMLLWLVL